MTLTTATSLSLHRELVASWLRLWNGELDLAETIIAPRFRLRAAVLGGLAEEPIDNAGALIGWIAGIRAVIENLTFTVEVGPIIDADHIALRWRATGRYSGGFPDATAAPGTPVAFTGTDVLRTENDRIAEYWLNSDMHVLLAQLRVHA